MRRKKHVREEEDAYKMCGTNAVTNGPKTKCGRQ
jgi:hypothetical protein